MSTFYVPSHRTDPRKASGHQRSNSANPHAYLWRKKCITYETDHLPRTWRGIDEYAQI